MHACMHAYIDAYVHTHTYTHIFIHCRFVGIGGKDQFVHIYDNKTGTLIQSFKGHRGTVSSLAFRKPHVCVCMCMYVYIRHVYMCMYAYGKHCVCVCRHVCMSFKGHRGTVSSFASREPYVCVCMCMYVCMHVCIMHDS